MTISATYRYLVFLLFLGAVCACGHSENKAKIGATKEEMKTIKSALKTFNAHAKRYPTTAEGLRALITKPEGLTAEQWPSKLLDENPLDAWGKEFIYKCPSEHGKKYDLISGGPDMQVGTEDDVTNFGTGKAKKAPKT